MVLLYRRRLWLRWMDANPAVSPARIIPSPVSLASRPDSTSRESVAHRIHFGFIHGSEPSPLPARWKHFLARLA
jgi:hypothetical protein